MSQRIAATLALALAVTLSGSALAQEKKPEVKIEDLTPEEKAERESRKACKVAICAAFRNKKPGEDLACSVVKTWRKEQLSKMVEKAKVSWPWGRIKCTSNIRLKRADLIKAMTEPKFEMAVEQHHVDCEVDRDKDGPAAIKFDFSPKVQFEAGKAVKAQLHWGKIEAPMLVKGAMWTATATDNTFNVLQGTLVDDINDFVGPKCDEVKDDWQGK